MRIGSLPASVGSARRSLLSLSELPTADRKCLRDQHADRGRPGRDARWCSPAGRPAGGRRQHAADLPLSELQVAVFSEYGRPELRYVRAGTLDQPSAVTPDVHIFTKSKVDWIAIPESAPAFDVYYDMQALWPAASLARFAAISAPPDSAT